MKFLLIPCLFGNLLLHCEAQLLINEVAATNSDRLLVREPGEYPRVGNSTPWQIAAFDDSEWKSGAGPFGFGDTGGITLGTNVTGDVQNRTPSLYLRKTFSVSSGNAASGSTLQLAVRYNDGFIAFLNGVEIARRNMGFAGMFAFRDQPAYNEHSSTALETIDLGTASSLLQTGDNLLSIQAHNHSVTGSDGADFLVAADLKLANGTVIADGETSWNYFAGLAEPSGGLIDYGQVAMETEDAPDVIWATPTFNDTSWISGTGPVGFESSDPPDYLLGVDLKTEMSGITPSVYVRSQFTVTPAEADSAFPLSLEVDYDDGMIVYLNGYEVYRGNVGTSGIPTGYTTTANGSHPATGDNGSSQDRSQTITLQAAKDLLVAGDNIVGIQIHNLSTGSSDLIGKVTLRTTGASPREIVSPSAPVKYFVGLAEPVAETETEDTGTIEDPPDSENDWIEIRNTDSVAVPLDGWSLSDQSDEPRKWSFPPGAVIPANGYYVVIASGFDLTPAVDGTSYAHTNFKLSASGDRIVLTRPDDSVEDELTEDYPAQGWRYTYGRQADGALGYLSLGTSGAENVGQALDEAPTPPEFNISGGFYPSSLSIVVTGATSGSTIRYTTDGSDPLYGTDYIGPISVTSNTVVRARSFLADSIPSSIVTHTYLINQSSPYQSLAAICLAGDSSKTFYGPNSENGPANGEGIFSINGGTRSGGGVWSSNGETDAFSNPNSRGRAFEKPGALEYLPLEGEPLRTELGIRVAASSYSRPRLEIPDSIDGPFNPSGSDKPSFNLFFRSEFGDRPLNYPFFGSNTVSEFEDLRIRAGKNDIKNPFIKDELVRRIFINSGQVGSYGTFNTVWVNGVYKGYYNLTERVREGFMQAHYNSKESWDIQQRNDFSDGDPTNWNKMIAYLRSTDLSSTTGYAGVHDFLDVDNFIDYILVNAYAGMWDWPNNNWIAGRERSSLGRWRFHVWDAEGAFGSAGRNTSYNTFTSDLIISDAQTTTSKYIPAIYTLLKESSEFRLRMADRAQKQLFNEGALMNSEMTAVYNQLKSEIEPIMVETTGDTLKSGFYNTWIASTNRRNTLFTQLSAQGAWPSTEAPTINQYGGEISGGFQVSLGNPNGAGTLYFTTDGSDPRAPGGAVVGSPYTGPVTLVENTRLRARVLRSGNWSPEIDVEFTLPFAHPTFLPTSSADWTDDDNWSSAPDSYPDAASVVATIPGVFGNDRNVNLRAPVTVGRLIFDLGTTTDRSRVRDRDSGNTLNFSNPNSDAEILVTGSAKGYAELEVEEGSILTSNLNLDIQHLGGDSEFGALRLRSDWSGSGGLIKTGSGIATLSGGGKDFTGATLIEQGVLQVSEPATPSSSASVTVLPGGQLRLTSGTGPGDPPRDYAFGGPLLLSGTGRGDEISDGEGEGRLGALRYEPGNTDNHAVISSVVELSAPADIHVAEISNRLELSLPLGGSYAMSKSGGGTLILSGDQSALNYPIMVDKGTLEIRGALGSTIDLTPTATLRGHGSTAAIHGEGSIILNQTLLDAPTSNASSYSFVFGQAGAPNFGSPAFSSNAAAILQTAPTGILALDFYLVGPAAVGDAIGRGGFLVPYTEDLENAISSASIRVFVPDPSGNHEFNEELWSPVSEYSLSSVAFESGLAEPFAQSRILQLKNGAGPPSSFEAWRVATFNAQDLANPLVSGPLAVPFGDGVNNLLRYAFGVPSGEHSTGYLPQLLTTSGEYGISFPFESSRDDLAVIVESSDTLADWSAAITLFNSVVDYPPLADGSGRMVIADTRPPVSSRFYRVRVIEK